MALSTEDRELVKKFFRLRRLLMLRNTTDAYTVGRELKDTFDSQGIFKHTFLQNLKENALPEELDEIIAEVLAEEPDPEEP